MFTALTRTSYSAAVRIVWCLAVLLSVLMPNGFTARAAQAGDDHSSLSFAQGTEEIEISTPVPTDTATLVSTEASSTPLPETAVPEETLTPAPTPIATESLVPGSTPVVDETQVSFDAIPGLTLKFYATPEQVTAGDKVIFTLEIVNDGKTPITGLQFSDMLPDFFEFVEGETNDFIFDPETRTVTWTAGKEIAIQPGEVLRLNYVVLLEDGLEDTQVINEASLRVDGSIEPLKLETTLLIASSGTTITMLDTKGGDAVGLDGRLSLHLPENVLDKEQAVVVKNLEEDFSKEGEMWLQFNLEIHSPQIEAAQPDTTLEGDRTIRLEKVEAEFEKPVELTILFDGITDLSTLTAELEPFLVTLDEVSGTWVRIPLTKIEPEANTITAELTHFSTWGVGFGPSFPDDGSGVLLYNEPQAALFTGSAQYSIPIWTPQGRNGMAPSLALSYSSSSVNGILSDIQSPWVGMGWNIDSVEIARQITNGGCSPCGSGSYGYKNKFVLLFNGTGYELNGDGSGSGRYHTESESFLYIQRHNDLLTPGTESTANVTSEWWEVVEKDGTRWRLGWNTDSEQLAAMKNYPGAATGAWATLGYAGHASDVVAGRWRADQVTDTFGNGMTFSYYEEDRAVAGISTNYNRASYPDTISYTTHSTGTPTPGYSVVFVREDHNADDIPASPKAWSNWDSYQLNRIEVKYGSSVMRTYDLEYDVTPRTDNGKTWHTTTLTSVAVSGGSTVIPANVFTYIYKNNRNCTDPCNNWAYPRLQTVDNGWGGSTTFTYEHDGRVNTSSWYNWRVTTRDTLDGLSGSNPMKTTYTYGTPCYKTQAPPDTWTCNSTNLGDLVGHNQMTETIKDFNGSTTLAIVLHKFHTGEQRSGREYEVQYQNSSGTVLSKTVTTYVADTATYPTGVYFTHATTVVEHLLVGTTLTQISKKTFQHDSATGNLTLEEEYAGTSATPYRKTSYEYIKNTTPSVWILDKLIRRTLQDSSGATVSRQEYGYDGQLPLTGEQSTLTQGKLTLSRVVNGTQTIDTASIYDAYGNVTETRSYKNYGSTSSQPSGTYISYVTGYDTSLKTYVVSSDPPLVPATTTNYDYGLGLPISVTDANGNTTSTTYDGLGRALTVRYPGYAQDNIKYTYPTASGTPLAIAAPFATKLEIRDDTISNYRSAWQIMDGLGRVIQTQGPYETTGTLVLTDTSYNARGLPWYSGLPRTYTGTGGTHYAPTWGSVPHTTNAYDALNRITQVTYPDSTIETTSYSGLRTTMNDRNSHRKIHENDAFGRLIKVEEYTGTSTYTLYATTNYTYEERDLLKQVTDQASNVTTINYDGYGRKNNMTDPDLGYWTYVYSVLGNLTSQTDARTCTTTITYDDLNRPTLKTYAGPGACDPTPDVTYTYDSTVSGNEGYGRRTGMSNANSANTWSYNVLGQITNETRNIESTNYSVLSTFDAFSRPLSQTLPSTEVLTYTYNDMGALSSLSGGNVTYVSQIHYNASGQVTDQLLGNGLRQQFCYDGNLRVTGLRFYPGAVQGCVVANPASSKFNYAYTYQNNGNISQIVDAVRAETMNYTYDDLDRLLTVSGAYTQNYSYNTIGNLTAKNGVTQNYADTAHKHAVSSLSSGETFTYDANGNMTARVEAGITYTQVFDAENRLVSMTASGQTIQFLYDGDGNLVKQIYPGGSKTLYVGGGLEIDKSSGGSITSWMRYYPVSGAMRVNDTPHWVLKDHLGSASVVTDASGTITGEQRYTPYGETRVPSGNMYTDILFTGQREITSWKVYHYGARFYSPKLGRFLSADTIVPGASNPQAWNRYSYVINNPLRHTDPTGHAYCDYIDNNNAEDCAGGLDKSQSTDVIWGSENDDDDDDNDDQKEETKDAVTSGIACTGMECLYGHAPSFSSISNPVDEFWDHQYTPLYFAIAQEFFAGSQEAGEWMIGAALATKNPVLGIVGAGTYVSSYALGRAAGGLGTYATIRQYYKKLNGTNGTDVYVSIGTTLAGIYAPAASKSSTVNLLYTAWRTSGGPNFEIPFLPRK